MGKDEWGEIKDTIKKAEDEGLEYKLILDAGQRDIQDKTLKRLAKKVGCKENDTDGAVMVIGTQDGKSFDFIDLLFKVCQYMDKKKG